MSTGKLLLLIGPSGVGKSVIMQHFKANHTDLHFPKSATTRARREGETDDLYHFLTNDEFDVLLEQDEVLEYAVVHGQARYATLKSEIIPYIEQGITVLREVDVQGFDSIRNHKLFRPPDPDYFLKSIFIQPESKEQLINHIKDRAPITDEELQRRLASMELELDYASRCDVQITNIEGQIHATIELVTAEIYQ